ncbi:putative protein Networked (NET), actin-binding (NAB) [Helianthus anomalus]
MQVPLQKEFKCTIRNSPELMKLVEEFYRAYRALAERYDFATNELYGSTMLRKLYKHLSRIKRYLSFSSLQTKHCIFGFFVTNYVSIYVCKQVV